LFKYVWSEVSLVRFGDHNQLDTLAYKFAQRSDSGAACGRRNSSVK